MHEKVHGKEDDVDEHKDLGKLICHASVMFRRHLDRAIAKATSEDSDPLSGRNFWILRYLEEHRDQDVFQKDLENAFKIRRSTVSKTVELMEQKQLIERVSVNGDARMKKLCLTPKADAVLAEVKQAVDELEGNVREAFSETDYQALSVLLRQLCVFLDIPDENGQKS